MMCDHGGFEHNRHGLRIVEHLENNYPDFSGLNLCYETLEGLKKHAQHFYPDQTAPFRTLEAELVDCADEIAYSSHDLDDGLRSGLITEEQLMDVSIWKEIYDQIKILNLDADHRKRLIVRRLINLFALDLVDQTDELLSKHQIQSAGDLQGLSEAIVTLSEHRTEQHQELKRFLMRNLYQHQYVVEMTRKGQNFIKKLFEAFLNEPKLLPAEFLARTGAEGLYRVICDYLAGMTDRFAVEEYTRLFEPSKNVS